MSTTKLRQLITGQEISVGPDRIVANYLQPRVISINGRSVRKTTNRQGRLVWLAKGVT